MRGRPSKALLRFVNLYVKGPEEVRGKWDEAAAAAELSPVPAQDDLMVQRLIEREGGEVMLDPEAPPAPLSALESLLGKADEGIPWKELRGELTEVIRAVAQGTVQARAAQVTMLRYIIEQAEKEAAEQEEVHSVILLPVQGTNAEMIMDQQWVDKIKSMETPAE